MIFLLDYSRVVVNLLDFNILLIGNIICCLISIESTLLYATSSFKIWKPYTPWISTVKSSQAFHIYNWVDLSLPQQYERSTIAKYIFSNSHQLHNAQCITNESKAESSICDWLIWRAFLNFNRWYTNDVRCDSCHILTSY